MALRVLPSLSLAVTEDAVRKQKRIVMFVPGLIAFAVYRLAKQVVPLSDPLTLLTVSSLFALVTAVVAYRVGRDARWPVIVREDQGRLLGWLTGWIGAVYGAQLSLLVLALLWLVDYNYLQHPDGPAMMAMIIASTAVARDAFEIGHVRKLVVMGRPLVTFPDGRALRTMLFGRMPQVAPWVVGGCALGGLMGLSGGLFEHERLSALAQLTGVTVVGGAISLCAYFSGLESTGSWFERMRRTSPGELLKYWWWPGMAFASTYYVVIAGVILFVGRQPSVSSGSAAAGGALVGGLMALYGYYLGHRRHTEDQERPQLTTGMLRCPFVMGILGKKIQPTGATGEAGDMVLSKSGSKG